MKLNLSIKNKLTLAFVIVILLMTALQTWLTGKQLLTETYRSVNQLSTTLTSSSVAGIEKWIEGRINIVNSAKDAFKYTDNPTHYFTQSTNSGKFEIAYAGLSDGRFLQGIDVDTPQGYDPRLRDWYKNAMNHGSTILTSPYKDASSGELVVTIASPFRSNGHSGVIGADVSINAIVQDIINIQQPGVFAVLVDGQGNFVAHRNMQLTQKPSTTISSEFTLSRIQDLALQNTQTEMMIDGILSFVDVKQVPHTNWYFAVIIDKDQSFAYVHSVLRDSTLIALLQIAVIAALALILIKKALSPLKTLQDAMEDLSKGNGNLTQRIHVESKDEIGALATQVNAFISKLQEMVKDIAGSSAQLNTQSKISTKLARQTNDGLSLQLGEISQIATAVHEMSATAQEVANNAQQTADAAITSSDNCQQGKDVILRNQQSITDLACQVQDASEIIQELEKNAQDINAILSTIRDIAEQTNLLALNAAIEAARAGEQGRGFAVVADEVRVLSQRTHNSTDEIRNMIETLQRNSANAVHTMQESQAFAQSSVEDANNATTALEEIAASIGQISDMATQISSAAAEQRMVTDEVSKNIQAVNDVSDQMSHEAENSQQLSEHLRSIAKQLNQQVNLFKH